MSDNLCEAAAYGYAARGWRVVPLHHVTTDRACSCDSGRTCPTPGKHPVISAWQKKASAAGADIAAWWEDNPNANVGIATGAESALWVLDVDTDKHGLASLQSLVTENGPMPRTRTHKTGSGGIHYFFTWPEFDVPNSTSYLGPGIDVRGTGGQVVAPPSVSGRGNYTVLADIAVTAAPEWLLERVREHSDRHNRGKEQEVRNPEPIAVEGMPPDVRQLASTLVEEDTGRFRHFYALVAACRRAGYTQGQTVTIVTPWCQAVGKFVGRVAAEVARAWGKLEDEDNRADEWVPGISGRPGAAQLYNDGSNALAPQFTPEPTPDAEITSDELPATWAPRDLSAILSGDYKPELPALLRRVDGVALLYPARVHSLHGESESGKSMVAQAEAARLLANGEDVLYIDFESDDEAVTSRLLAMGATTSDILDHFTYVRPEGNPYRMLHEKAAWERLLAHRYTFAVLDGVTDALVTFGAGTKETDDVAAWFRLIPRKIATSTGAAVAIIDHVPKDADNRGRFAIGSQVKMASLDGAAYLVEVAEALGRGLRGLIVLRVAKDRPGAVRPHCGPFRKSDRTQEAARITVDSTNEEIIRITIDPPRTGPAGHDDLRPTYLMQKVSELLEQTPDPLSQSVILEHVSGKAEITKKAILTLVKDGFIQIENGPRNSLLHKTVRPYRQELDPASDTFIPTTETTSAHLGPTSSPNRSQRPRPSPPSPTGGDEVSGPAKTTPTSAQLCKSCGDADATFIRGVCNSCGGG